MADHTRSQRERPTDATATPQFPFDALLLRLRTPHPFPCLPSDNPLHPPFGTQAPLSDRSSVLVHTAVKSSDWPPMTFGTTSSATDAPVLSTTSCPTRRTLLRSSSCSPSGSTVRSPAIYRKWHYSIIVIMPHFHQGGIQTQTRGRAAQQFLSSLSTLSTGLGQANLYLIARKHPRCYTARNYKYIYINILEGMTHSKSQ